MKKLILITLIYSILLIGCSKAGDTNSSDSTSTTSSTEESTSYSSTKVTLPSKTINYNESTQNLNFIASDLSYSKFISINFFCLSYIICVFLKSFEKSKFFIYIPYYWYISCYYRLTNNSYC